MKIISIALLFTILLCSCYQVDNLSKQPTNTQLNMQETINLANPDGCIAPLTNFAYPVGDSGLPGPVQKEVLPPKSWKLVATLPTNSVEGYGNSIESEIIYKNGDHDEIWIIPTGYKGIYILNLKTKEWKQIDMENDSLERSFLFLDNNNSIWAAKGITGKSSLLLRFNNQLNRFEKVSDADGLLNRNVEKLSVASIKIDSNGIFWMVILNNDVTSDSRPYLLYSFNPLTLKAEKINLDYKFDGALAVGPNGFIYLLDSQKGIVIAYETRTRMTNTYELLTKTDSTEGYGLFYDSQDRLWISDIGWFDFSKEQNYYQWFEIVRPPIFLTYIVPAGLWRRGNPLFTFEDSVGLLWFSSDNGVGWLDPSVGKWCIITSFSNEVLRDSNHNLWMLINDSLYENVIKK